MKCPYCQEEMQSGYIHNSNQPVQWIPEGKKPSGFSFTVSDDGVTLSNEFKPFKANGYRAKAYYCNKCHLVIAPTKE